MKVKMKSFLLTVLFFAFLFTNTLWAQNGLLKVACIGNSVTYGYGLKDPALQSYPGQLQQLLGDKYSVGNFGRSGATLLKKGHNPYYKTPEFLKALQFIPDIAVIHLGLNDTDPRNWPNYKFEFSSDYSWLLDTLKKVNPSIKIYICQLTPIFSGHPRFKSGTRAWYDQIQKLIPEIAAANNAGLIDLNKVLFNRPDLFADNLHPDKEGAAIIARAVYHSLTNQFGGLKVATVFADNMVLQRRIPIPFFGTSNPGDKITVAFKGQNKTVITNSTGLWKATFPPSMQGGPYELKINSKELSISFKNILVGDVWLCSGQSNMEFPLKNAATGAAELKAGATNPFLRLYKFNSIAETNNATWDSATLTKVNSLDFFNGMWQESNASTAQNFSAVGYYFGKKIVAEEGVPIGLIQVAVGGAPTESWIDRSTLEHNDLFVDMISNWRKSDFILPWCRDRADVNLKKATNPKQRHPFEPSYNYEAGIASLVNFPIKGVVWYQGESNAHNIELHEQLFTTLVESWRAKWGYQFPFYFVQLSSIDRPSWPEFRNSQRLLSHQLLNTRMAVSSDLGDSLNVHPTHKKEIGERLALLALKHSYNKPIIASGPEPMRATQKGHNIVITFSSAKQLSAANNQVLTGFEMVNIKGYRFLPKAIIRKNEVILPVPDGEHIKTILYGWQPFTRANLVNEALLPASTFSINVKN